MASTIAAVGIVLGASLSATLVGAGPAAAAPTNCKGTSYWQVPGFYSYVCTDGTGYYRAVAYCSNTPGGWGIYKYGPWNGITTDIPSRAYCDNSYPYLVSGYGERKG